MQVSEIAIKEYLEYVLSRSWGCIPGLMKLYKHNPQVLTLQLYMMGFNYDTAGYLPLNEKEKLMEILPEYWREVMELSDIEQLSKKALEYQKHKPETQQIQ